MTRRFAYLAGTFLLAVLGLFAAAPAASAHATLVSSSPADGAVLARAPAQVSATFDEQVGIAPDSLEVFSPNGERVDAGSTAHGSQPQVITVALLPGLVRGTYTVGWHVISDDSHPIQGAFTFSIGAKSGTVVNAATLGLHGSKLVGVAFGFVRWLAFCCFALLIGAVAFVIWCWPAGASRAPVLRLAMGAWGGLAFSVLAAVLLQGVYGTAQGIGHLFWPDVLHATLYSRYGRAIGIRLLLVIVALFAFSITLGSLSSGGRRARVASGAVWGVLTVALASTWAVADHSGTGIQVPLAIPADVVHLSAIAIWLGGLVMLAMIVLRRSSGAGFAGEAGRRRGQPATAEAAQAVIRFSPLALSCVIAILITGTYQAWRGVGTLSALIGTTYGRLLLVKIAAMCALIALGYVARRLIASGLQGQAAPAHADAGQAVPASLAGADAGPGSGSSARTGRGAGARPANGGARPANGGGRQGRGTNARSGNGATARLGQGAGARQGRGARPAKASLGARQSSGASTVALPGRGDGATGSENGRAARGTGPGLGGGASGATSRRDRTPGTGERPGRNGSGAAAGIGSGNDPGSDQGRVAVTLSRLRWSVVAETAIAAAVPAVTAVLVNTPTARESFAPSARAAVAFDTGGPGGRGSIGVRVSPARLGTNQVRLSVTGSAGGPDSPQQIEAALSLPARHLGPLPVPLTPDGAGRYLGHVTISVTGQWRLQITIRSDASGEATVAVPVSVH